MPRRDKSLLEAGGGATYIANPRIASPVARRKRKEEDVVFTPPEFDEVAYMQKEIENAKIAVVVIAWAVVGAIIAFVLWEYVHPVVGFLVGLAAFGALYFLLPALGLPIHGFKRRDWFSQGTIYFFSWLAFWIIILNAPFGDHTAPVVTFTSVAGYDQVSGPPVGATGLICVPASNGAVVHVGAGNRSIYVLFRATDNVGVTRIQVQVGSGGVTANSTYTPVGGLVNTCAGSGGAAFPASTYALSIPITANNFLVTVTDWDAAGLSGTATLNILTP